MSNPSVFQAGPYVDIFSTQGRNPTENCKVSPANASKKIFDKNTKGFVYSLEGTSSAFMQFPKDEKKGLYLTQPFLVFQVFIALRAAFSVEITFCDTQKNKKRIHLSTAFKEVSSTPLHCRIPAGFVKQGVWLNFCVDLLDIAAYGFGESSFRNIESFVIHPYCQIRRIFTMKSAPLDTSDDYDPNFNNANAMELPKSCALPLGVTCVTQVFNSSKVTAYLSIIQNSQREDLDESRSRQSTPKVLSSSKPNYDGPMHIAFGKRAPVPPSTASSSSRPGSKARQERSNSLPLPMTPGKLAIQQNAYLMTFDENGIEELIDQTDDWEFDDQQQNSSERYPEFEDRALKESISVNTSLAEKLPKQSLRYSSSSNLLLSQPDVTIPEPQTQYEGSQRPLSRSGRESSSMISSLIQSTRENSSSWKNVRVNNNAMEEEDEVLIDDHSSQEYNTSSVLSSPISPQYFSHESKPRDPTPSHSPRISRSLRISGKEIDESFQYATASMMEKLQGTHLRQNNSDGMEDTIDEEIVYYDEQPDDFVGEVHHFSKGGL